MSNRLIYLTCSIAVLCSVTGNTARADLIGWWPFNDGAGTTVVDSSGQGHNGTINGNPVWAAGTLGGALQFDGAGDYVMCDLVNIDTSVTGGMTVCGWINRPAGGDRKLCSNRQASNALGGGFTCAIYNDRMEMDICNAAGRVLSRDAGGPTVPANTWVHVAWVFDDVGNLFKEYHNGVMVDSDPVTISVGVSTVPFRIGCDAPNVGIYFLGTMDDWRVYNHVLSEAELQDAMAGRGTNAELASEPVPADKATDVLRETILSWTAGEFAATHDVYLGTVAADVEAASRDNPLNVLVSQGRQDTTFDPGRLEFGRVYYWRVDEVNAAPANKIFKGEVWSFTAETYSSPIPGARIKATASGTGPGMGGPVTTIDGSGLNGMDQHSVDASAMWLSGAAGPHWIQYEFDKAYLLDKLLVWNQNQVLESIMGFGARTVAIEYSVDGQAWTPLEGVPEFAQATAVATYTANTTVDFGGVMAKYVKLTISSNWGGIAPQAGLAEVRFLYVPVAAREPVPASGATDVSPRAALSWRSGRQTGAHKVFLGTDANSLALVDTVTEPAYEADLNLRTTYYWKVVEVNQTEATPEWEGDVWSFSTVKALVVDDFESYTDNMDTGAAIFQTWIDGYEDNANGSIVGYGQAPFAEQTIVQNGKQAMPLFYDNSGGATYSEAERTFDDPQDWTRHGFKALSLAFYGDANNVGQLYLKINNTKVPYNGKADDIKKPQWQPWNIDLASTGASLQSVTKLAIGIDGAGAAGTLYFDDIRLQGAAPEFITPVDPGTTGLLAWYKFDGDLKDATGKNHGTALGDAKTGNDPARGQVLLLDGIGDAVDVPLLAATTSTLTIAMWVNSTVDPVPVQFASFFHSDNWTAGDLHWRYSYGKVDSGINAVSANNITGKAIVRANQWNHVAVTVSPTEWALWLNGYKEASLALTTTPSVILGDGLIGAWLGTDNATVSRFFTGKIDDARFYNRTLSQEELASLAGRTEPFPKPF